MKVQKFLKENFLILFVISIAFGIRFLGVYPGYPQYHPDEGTSYHSAVRLLYYFLHPGRFDYPAGMPFIHALIYINFFIPSMIQKLIITDPINIIRLITNPALFFYEQKEAIFGNYNVNAMYWSRYITAAFGAMTVGLLYITAKRLFNKWVGLFGAIFLTFNFRHVLGSHFGLPDVLSGFFAMLVLLVSILLFEKNTKQRYLLAGLIAGIYFCLKYQPFAFLPFFVVHLMWAIRKRNLFYLFHFPFIASVLLSALVFLLVNPYYFLNISEAIRHNSIDFNRYQMGILRVRLYPIFYLYHWGLGAFPFIAILGGTIAMLFTNPKKFILPFSFAAVYMFFMTFYSNGGIYSRNFIQVMPFLIMFAGYFTYILYVFLRKFFNKNISLVIISLLLVIINFNSAKNSVILGLEYSKPWTVVALSRWLEEKIPEGTTVRHYPLFIPSKTVLALREKNIELLSWSYDRESNTLAEFQEEGADFAIINAYNYQSTIYYWREFPKPQMYLQYNNIPFDYIENSFHGINVRELMQYTVFEIYKPWQAQETSNFLVFKIPEKPKEIGNIIKKFTFDTEKDLWKLRGNIGADSVVSEWDFSQGRDGKGSIKMTKQAGVMVSSRFASDPIVVTPGKLYTVRGWIKNSLPRWTYYTDKDGFLRMDFYRNDNKKELSKIGIGVALSNRAKVTENGDWIRVQGSVVAPKDAKYLTISFQLQEGNYYWLYLDDVELYETDQIPSEPFKEIPYIPSTIPKESLYFNSFL